MIRKIGRFSAYFPDEDIAETFLKMLSLHARPRTVIRCPSYEVHKFFLEIKRKYPDKLEDVFFNADEEYPYSSEVENAFNRLQESGYLTRPNPSLDDYMVVTDLSQKKPLPSSANYQFVKEVAQLFSEKFEFKNEQPNC